MVANKLCATVALTYPENVSAENAEVVKHVRLKTGCYSGGQYVFYKQFRGYHSGVQQVTFDFNDFTIELHSEDDPFISFLKIDTTTKADQSLFFWLSCLCLMGAVILIFVLGFVYKMYIEEEERLHAAAEALKK